jgi:hypothetical protein
MHWKFINPLNDKFNYTRIKVSGFENKFSSLFRSTIRKAKRKIFRFAKKILKKNVFKFKFNFQFPLNCYFKKHFFEFETIDFAILSTFYKKLYRNSRFIFRRIAIPEF